MVLNTRPEGPASGPTAINILIECTQIDKIKIIILMKMNFNAASIIVGCYPIAKLKLKKKNIATKAVVLG